MWQRLFPHRGLWIAGAILVTGTALGARHYLAASDHRDSALLTANPAEDIADVYTFRSPVNPNNTVLAMTVNGFIPPSENATTYFDPEVIYQIKIDTNGDAVEDLVLQAFVTGQGANQVMHIRGPAVPSSIGTSNALLKIDDRINVPVSHDVTPIVRTNRGVSAFAGIRDDPFFFDLAQFKQVVSGHASKFNNPGTDTFAGFNILAIVVELPSGMLGSNSKISVWGTTNRIAP